MVDLEDLRTLAPSPLSILGQSPFLGMKPGKEEKRQDSHQMAVFPSATILGGASWRGFRLQSAWYYDLQSQAAVPRTRVLVLVLVHTMPLSAPPPRIFPTISFQEWEMQSCLQFMGKNEHTLLHLLLFLWGGMKAGGGRANGAIDDPRTTCSLSCSLCYTLEQGVEEGAEGGRWAGAGAPRTPFALSFYYLQGTGGLLDQLYNIKAVQMQMIPFSISWSQRMATLELKIKLFLV